MQKRTRKARTTHRCVLCNLTIETGTGYVSENVPPSVDCPYWITYKSHIRCDDFWNTGDMFDDLLPGPMGHGAEFLGHLEDWLKEA